MQKVCLFLLIGVTLLSTPVKQLDACTAPTITEKRVSFSFLANCVVDQNVFRKIWTCTATSGTYKIRVGVTSYGQGGEYVVECYDRTLGQSVGSGSFTSSGTNCAAGDFTATLTNGNEYELWIDAFSTDGCEIGEHAWAKMCYTCAAN